MAGVRKANGVPAPSPFARYDRATVQEYLKQRFIGVLYGENGSRKTSFALEAPGPIIVYSFDHGLEGVVSRILEDDPNKEIYVRTYDWFPTKDADANESLQARALEIREEFMEDYQQAIKIARTVDIDKETDLWNILRVGEFGVHATDAPKNYDGINAYMRRVINMAKAENCNLFLIDGMKDKWGEKVNKTTGVVGGAPTGARMRDGFKEAEGLAHLSIYFEGVNPDTWQMSTGKVRGPAAPQVAGKVYDWHSVPDFKTFAQMVFPDTEESDWV